jgi:hypothetical protein
MWGLLEITKASERVVDEARQRSTAASIKSGLLECSRTCSREPSIVDVERGLRAKWP